jgi:hypothetical protein
VAASTSSTRIRTIHKLTPTNSEAALSATAERLGTPIKPITFGLTAEQIQRLKTVTEGRVDFSNLYAVDATDKQELASLQQSATYLGSIRSKLGDWPKVDEMDGRVIEISKSAPVEFIFVNYGLTGKGYKVCK